MKDIQIGLIAIALLSFVGCGTSITDADGNIYTSVKIGNQEWMVENLRTSKYSDGTPIPNVTNNSQWDNLSSGAWSHYNNDSQYETTYGKLYNWDAATDSRNICPTGWHVPKDGEWTLLTDYLAANGHSGTQGVALKSKSGWGEKSNGTDDYGWKARPVGYRFNSGDFDGVGQYGYWWSSSESSTSNAWYRSMDNDIDSVFRTKFKKRLGIYIRCLKD
mgnify:FL=1